MSACGGGRGPQPCARLVVTGQQYLSGAMVVDSTELLLAALVGYGGGGGDVGGTLFLMPLAFHSTSEPKRSRDL